MQVYNTAVRAGATRASGGAGGGREADDVEAIRALMHQGDFVKGVDEGDYVDTTGVRHGVCRVVMGN